VVASMVASIVVFSTQHYHVYIVKQLHSNVLLEDTVISRSLTAV